jgi:glucan biosynthesis protein C
MERRYDLDWIRVGAFFLLILYHVGMFYVPWPWHVKSPHPVEWLQPVMQLTNPWRLPLLFLVSGAATRFMADKITAGGLARLLGRLGGWGLIVWPVGFFAVLRLTLFPIFEVTHAFIDDWYNHAVSFSLFLGGFSIAKSEALRAQFIRMRWPALVIALAAYAAWAAYAWTYRAEDAMPPEALRQAMRAVYAADLWCAIAAALGFGAKHLNRGGPVLTYLTLAVFPFYIAHQTIIVVAGHHLARLGLPQGLEAAILLTLTFGGCFVTYEVVRRVNWLRPLFGLKPQPALARAYA